MGIRIISRHRPCSVDDAEVGHFTWLGSLRSYYGDAEDNVGKKRNLHFSYESRDTLKSFTSFINKFEIEI